MVNTILQYGNRFHLDLRQMYFKVCARSLHAAIKEQGLKPLAESCREIVSDLRRQYTVPFKEEDYALYFEPKLRGLHAFQVAFFLEVLKKIHRTGLHIVDIGDSCGTHSKYFKALSKPGEIARFVSVNLDPTAVEKVKNTGGEAILSRAEDLPLDFQVDLFTLFETLEHFTDPLRFLHRLAEKGQSDYLLVTVPYRRTSRFGGNPVRYPLERLPSELVPEDVHFFELNPDDWTHLAGFAGWRLVFQKIYLQYPQYSPLRFMAPFWRQFDFEGFVGFLFERDLSRANRYTGW